jgi:RIO kinase 1
VEDGSLIPAREHAADWEASPRLKDASIPSSALPGLYIETLHILRRLWRVCKLVHADFSEYNILYSISDGHLYTIDVSQSVEGDHPHAFDFLRADIGNVDEFFARRGVRTLGLKRTFELTVEKWGPEGRDGEESVEEVGQEMERRFALADEAAAATAAAATEGAANTVEMLDGQNISAQNDAQLATADEEDDDAAEEEDRIFKQSYIPRNLNEVFDAERDVQRVLRGEKDQLIYAQTVGIVAPTPVAPLHSEGSDDGSSSSESGSDDDDGEEGEDGVERIHRPRGKRHEDKDAKRERKQAVKEEKREKRKEKMPKGVKKAKVKKTSGKGRK